MPRKNRKTQFVKFSSLAQLTERQEAQLMTWFLTEDALTYEAARQRLIDRFGVTVNVRALHTFWHRYCEPTIREAKGLTGRVYKPFPFKKALDALTPEQRAQVKGWFLDENLSYQKARARIASQFGVKVGVEALWNFWQNECATPFDDAHPPYDPLHVIIKRGNRILAKTTFPPQPVQA